MDDIHEFSSISSCYTNAFCSGHNSKWWTSLSLTTSSFTKYDLIFLEIYQYDLLHYKHYSFLNYYCICYFPPKLKTHYAQKLAYSTLHAFILASIFCWPKRFYAAQMALAYWTSYKCIKRCVCWIFVESLSKVHPVQE